MAENKYRGGVPVTNGYKICTQHLEKVSSTDPGEDIVSSDKLTRRWICSACKKHNLEKLAKLFGIEDTELELT